MTEPCPICGSRNKWHAPHCIPSNRTQGEPMTIRDAQGTPYTDEEIAALRSVPVTGATLVALIRGYEAADRRNLETMARVVEQVAAELIRQVNAALATREQQPIIVNVTPIVEAIMPPRMTTTKVERDPRSGLISKTTSTEKDV